MLLLLPSAFSLITLNLPPLLFQTILNQFSIEGLRIDAERLGSTISLVARCFQDLQNMLPFHVFKADTADLLHPADIQREVLWCDEIVFRQEEGAVKHILQFPHIPGPGVS